MINSHGANGHPCLIPLLISKAFVILSFKQINILTFWNNNFTIPMKVYCHAQIFQNYEQKLPTYFVVSLGKFQLEKNQWLVKPHVNSFVR
jgi:hypothetical protein